MTPSQASRLRPPLSPAARAMRLQRIFARLQEGAGYVEIAAEEGISRERIGQIMRRATARGREGDRPDHSRMQVARLTPALRLAAAGVAQGDGKAIPLLLSLLDRLDRYSDPDTSFRSRPLEEFVSSRSRPGRVVGSRPARKARRAPDSTPEPVAKESVNSPAPNADPPSP